MKKIAVIGGGASGIHAALFASNKKNMVTLFEKQNKIGKKILASGNGRCNLSNSDIDVSNYHGMNPKFVLNVLSRFGQDETIEFFESIGIPVVEENDGRLFPASLNAASITKIFEYELAKRSVELRLHRKIEKIVPQKNRLKVVTAGKEEHIFDSVILSSGGCAYPQLGASKIGYRLASSLGHRIIEPFPAILPINIPLKAIHRLEGIKRVCRLSVELNGNIIMNSVGDLLFTKYGISGTVSLDISRIVNESIIGGKSPWILIDFFPDLSRNEFLEILEKLFYDSEKEAAFSLTGIMQYHMSEVLMNIAGIDPKMSVGSITENDKKQLAQTLKSLRVAPGEPRSFKDAVAAAGGVDVNEVNPATMESKIVKNLYITGELLDIDGDSGGYNLQFAWSTGAIAGMSQL